MKRLLHSIAVIPACVFLGCVAGAGAVSPPPLTSVRAIHQLTNAEAAKELPVAFEGSVIYYKRGDASLFVQDGDLAIYVETTPDAEFTTGDRVLVRGKTEASFRPQVKSRDVTLLRHGTAPAPVEATFRQLIRADLDCRRVKVRAIVRSANLVNESGQRNVYLQLLIDGGNIDAEVVNGDASGLKELLDTEVEVIGAVSGKFDRKMQMTGILLEVPLLSDLKVLRRADAVRGTLALTPIDEIIKSYDVQDRSQRARVQGTLTYYQPGAAAVIQSGDKSLWIQTQFEKPLHLGDLVDVTGFPDVQNGSVILTRGDLEDRNVAAGIAPQKATATELAHGDYPFDQIAVEGRVLMAIRESVQDEYVLVADGNLFSALYRHPEHGDDIHLDPMKHIPIGSTVRITGICILENAEWSDSPVAFQVLLPTAEDVTIVASPSLLNVRNLALLAGALLLAVLGIGAKGWRLERRVRRQTAALARIEQQRSRILEDISGARPLTEVLEQITELVSLKLQGAPCWCQVTEESQLGKCPQDFTGLRVERQPVTARSGSRLGTLYAALGASTAPCAVETEALAMGAGLATLAIETRRLYSDLRRRSEFDLLTNTHNRFSFDNRLEVLVEQAAAGPSRFGLIYVDLDGFKQINDLYGHHVGDLYLKQVAERMKRHIRPPDMLARLGGDEFAILTPMVRGRGDVEEIAHRIEACFDDPLAVDGLLLTGSASLGLAVYPEDGATKDRIFNSADAAMYLAKHAKHSAAQAKSMTGTTPIRKAV